MRQGTTDLDRRFALARIVARDAGAQALGYWRALDGLTVEAKGNPQDLVSEADRAVEAAMRAAVAAAFPDDGFLGEELGFEAGTSGWLWVIDPIDGTAPFLAGMPTWCVALALVEDGATQAAVTVAPALGETYAAQAGGGLTVNDRPVRIPAALTIRTGSTAVGASHRTDPDEIGRLIAALLRAGGMYFRNGSGALMLAYVAAGRLAGYFEPHMNAWDSLGGLLMVREAGGRTAPYAETGLRSGGRVLAAAPGAFDALVELAG